MQIKLTETNVTKRADGWYERTIQLACDDPPYEVTLPTITHYVGKEKSMEANIDKEVLEIMTKFIASQKKPDISASLAICEKKANNALLKAVG